MDDMQLVLSYHGHLEISPASLAKLFGTFTSILSLKSDTNFKPAMELLKVIGVKDYARFVT